MERRVPLVRTPVPIAADACPGLENEMEATSLAGICAVMMQMAELASHTLCIFDELQLEMDAVANRSSAISMRLNSLQLQLSEASDGLLPRPTGSSTSRQGQKNTVVPLHLPAIESMLASESEPVTVSAALEVCRPPPDLDCLEEYVQAEEAPCHLRYSQAGLGIHRARPSVSRSKHIRQRYASVTPRTPQESSIASSEPGWKGEGQNSKDEPCVCQSVGQAPQHEHAIPAAQPGGDSPDIEGHKRGMAQQRRPPPSLVSRTAGNASSTGHGECAKSHATKCEAGSICTSAINNEASLYDGVEAPQIEPFLAMPTDDASIGASSPDSAFLPFAPSPMAKACLGGPMSCASPAVKGRNKGAPAEVEYDPSNPFVTPKVEPPASSLDYQHTCWNYAEGLARDESPDRFSEAATEVTLSNYCASLGDVPPPIACVSPPKSRCLAADQQGDTAPEPATKAEVTGPAVNDMAFQYQEGPQIQGNDHVSAAVPHVQPPGPPPRPKSMTPDRTGPPCVPISRGSESGDGVLQTSNGDGGRLFSASDLLAGRAKLKATSVSKHAQVYEGNVKENAACLEKEKNLEQPAELGSLLAFSAADLLIGRSKLQPVLPKGTDTRMAVPENKDARSQMLDIIRRGNVQLRRTPTSTPPGMRTPTGVYSSNDGHCTTMDGGSHMAALLQKVHAIRQSTQEDSCDDESWDD